MLTIPGPRLDFAVVLTWLLWVSSAVVQSHGRAFFPSRSSSPHHKLFFTDERDSEVVRAVVGDNVILECEASGIPAPTIHWLHHGRRIIQGDSRDVLDDEASYEANNGEGHRRRSLRLLVSTTKSRLFIDRVQKSDAGQYVCVAQTPTKRIVSRTNLEIGSSHKHRQSFSRHRPDREALPARIYMWSVQRMDLEGADVQLYCRADGRPAPTVTWYDVDDRPIGANDHQYEMLSNGDLLIRGISWRTNMGVYRCVANNTAGSDSVDSFLYPTTLH